MIECTWHVTTKWQISIPLTVPLASRSTEMLLDIFFFNASFQFSVSLSRGMSVGSRNLLLNFQGQSPSESYKYQRALYGDGGTISLGKFRRENGWSLGSHASGRTVLWPVVQTACVTEGVIQGYRPLAA